MIIVMKPSATPDDMSRIIGILEAHDLIPHVSAGTARTIIGVVGDKSRLDIDALSVQPGVEKLVPIMESYKLAGRAFKPEGSCFEIGGVVFGGGAPVQMAGPCAVEDETQLFTTAEAVARAGARVLRGGAFKPRTSPYSFQGLGVEGLRLMRAAADAFGLLVISEITSENDLEAAADYVDIVQIGARNAQNFRLLSAVGRARMPVMLKRGLAESIEEWLGSAEYILTEGEYRVMLCERGIRTFETATRSTLDIGAIPVLKEKTHLPVFVDPSHAAGRSALVPALSLAGMAAGADGLIIEVHPNPPCAKSDAAQQLTPAAYTELMARINRMVAVLRPEM